MVAQGTNDENITCMNYSPSYIFFPDKVKLFLWLFPAWQKSSELFAKSPEDTVPSVSVWGLVLSHSPPPVHSKNSEPRVCLSIQPTSLPCPHHPHTAVIRHVTEMPQSWLGMKEPK